MSSRKDYERTARVIKSQKDEVNRKYAKGQLTGVESLAHHEAIDGLARRFASTYAQDNSRFDANRFYKACGV